MFVMGVNNEKYDPKTMDVVSNASCTVSAAPALSLPSPSCPFSVAPLGLPRGSVLEVLASQRPTSAAALCRTGGSYPHVSAAASTTQDRLRPPPLPALPCRPTVWRPWPRWLTTTSVSSACSLLYETGGN